jgi:DNA invertase Pin-like site-specific DNA recombinase
MIYGYARVSTAARELANQLPQLKAAGCERIFREKITGANAERRQLERLLAAVAHGDLVITPTAELRRLRASGGGPEAPNYELSSFRIA